MMRLNPSTNERFHRGDLRGDGFVFFAYTNKLKADGYFKEIWLSPSASSRATHGDKIRKRRARGSRVKYTDTNG
jgi:hypothetical protein